MDGIGNSIVFRLRGTKSNRDAIGAAVTVEAAALRQTKHLQAGSGFLSQHTKELFFGLGKNQAPIHAIVRWPSGLTQAFALLPVNHRVEIEEGARDFLAQAVRDLYSLVDPFGRHPDWRDSSVVRRDLAG